MILRAVWLLLCSVSVAQTPPAPSPGPSLAVDRSDTDAWFLAGPLPELRVELGDAEVESLRRQPKVFVRGNLREGASQVYRSVGIKLKGSYGSFRDFDDRPGLTISMDRFGSEETFHGLRKFHLNNGVQDASLLHETLAYEIFRRAGYPAPQITHGRLKINGRDVGIYVLKEGFDERFVSARLGRSDGNLYDGGTNGDVHDALDRDAGSGRNNYEDLKKLHAACEEPDPERRRTLIAASLDLDRFFTFMALELMIAHWDGYTQNPNNYRLYFDGEHQRGLFLPHGCDQVFGDSSASIVPSPGGKVAQVVMGVPEWRALYFQRVQALLPIFDPPEPLLEFVRGRELRLITLARVARDAEGCRDLKRRWTELEGRITDRVRFLREAVHQPQPQPLDVGSDGVSLAEVPWSAKLQCDDVQLDRVEGPSGPLLQIQSGRCRRCIGSWRTKILLPPGRYEFRARMNLADVEAFAGEGNPGAGIRISGGHRVGLNEGSGERSGAFPIEVTGGVQEVVLVMELRATQGRVEFPLDSLRLVRKSP